MISDSELIERLRDALSKSDLSTTTNTTLRRRLEEELGIDLSDRKAFIREQVDIIMQGPFQNDDRIGDEGSPEAEEEEEDEVEESSNSGTVKKVSKNSGTVKKGSRTKDNEEVKKRGGGFTKLCSLSPELQKFTGVPELARTEVVKQLWVHIKENNLQDPSNRKSIICDDTLNKLFGVDTIDMFQMNKALTKHIWPLDSDGASVAASVDSAPKVKQKKKAKDEVEDEPKRKGKRQRGGNSAFLAPIKLSDALVKFLGTGESALPRSDVVKRIWDYIKLNNLQDPSDKRQILCDEKLKELFNLDTFCGFTVSKHLTAHFIKTEQVKAPLTGSKGLGWGIEDTESISVL
ncbi:upstream activation factor subunit UAF30-like [Salvia splendens]|uniref:upstream activation factor subunit UAF30-like n=1 Tax=Salvia splendens TaxID=180675 RepID=UPI001C280967|nr:upstream activation factor subunit UAF30-like [Salvia splendens]